MQPWQKLLLLCSLLSISLFAAQPARVQSDLSCSAEGNAASIESSLILDCLRAGVPVNFEGVTVTGNLDLTALSGDGQSLIVSVPLILRNVHFTSAVSAFDGDRETTVIFQEQVDLRGSRFDDLVDFSNAAFERFAHFERTVFASEVNFTQALFRNGASFSRATFQSVANFVLAENQGGLDYMDAQFFGPANFAFFRSTSLTQVPADVFFSGAHFESDVYFMQATFENQVNFDEAVFRRTAPEQNVNLSMATFTALNFTGASFENGQLMLEETYYEKILMPDFQPTILSPDNPEEALTALKDNFRRQGHLEIANEIAYWQNTTQGQAHSGFEPILKTIFLDWTFGYGLKPLNAVRTSLILILFFAAFYYPEGVLRPATFAPSKPRERRFTIRLSELPIALEDEREGKGMIKTTLPLPAQVVRAWQAIIFSFGVFTKLSSGDYVAVRARAAVIAEWIIGLMLIAGFLFSLANTNPLLRSVLDLLK